MAVGDMVSRYNIAPGFQVLSIRLQESGETQFDLAHWGFKPTWAAEKAPKPINARIESLASSRYFQQAFQRQRCVITGHDGYKDILRQLR